ncbi:MAG: S8 family serine peptidase, partial [Planctomycetota bacterium]
MQQVEGVVQARIDGRIRLGRSLLAGLLFAAVTWVSAGGAAKGAGLSDPEERMRVVERLARRSEQRKAAAWHIAQSQGWVPKGQINDTVFELMAIEGDRVYAYKTCNLNAAISIGVDLIRNTAPYDVNGVDLMVGIWDGGGVRPTHQEFGGRVAIMDGAASISHATHVGGTIGAAGIQPSALGMAPRVLIDSYEWDADLSEMTSRAMSYPGEPDKIQMSNHSYGYICGWEHGFSPPRWYGTWGNRESDYFGIYDSEVAQWDGVCYNAPYYLPFKAAGNDRNDNAPSEGQVFRYYKWPKWRSKVYNSATDPYDDG